MIFAQFSIISPSRDYSYTNFGPPPPSLTTWLRTGIAAWSGMTNSSGESFSMTVPAPTRTPAPSLIAPGRTALAMIVPIDTDTPIRQSGPIATMPLISVLAPIAVRSPTCTGPKIPASVPMNT